MLACRSATGKSWRARKRQACDEGARVDKQGIVSDDAIAEDVSSLWLPMDCTGTYNMDVLAERESLALTLWRGDYAESCRTLRDANPLLVKVLEAQIQSASKPTPSLRATKIRLIDGVLLNLIRARSQKRMPVLSAALSILAEMNQLSRELHDGLTHYFRGTLSF